jgi:hypothetical protein
VLPSSSTIAAGPWRVVHRALHEHEIVRHPTAPGQGDERLALALTLVRSIGWLSRRDLVTRGVGAGPDLATPEAQGLGADVFEFELLAREAGQPGAFAMPRAESFRRPPLLLRGHGLNGPGGPEVGNAVALTSSVRRLADGRIELRLWTPIAPSHEIALRPPAWQAAMADGRPDPVYTAQPGLLFKDRILTLRESAS